MARPNPTTVRPHVLKNFENVTGSNYADFIVGSRAVNELDGGAGNDQLQAVGTGDFLTGGTGADKFFYGGSSTETATITVTDFHYNEGDRLVGNPVFSSWVAGSAPDVDGNLQPAWIGTVEGLQLIVLGADTTLSDDWFI